MRTYLILLIHVTHIFIWLVDCFYVYVLCPITADVSGSNVPFNLSVYTCLLLSHAWNTNVTNANANESLTKTSANLLRWLKDKSPSACLEDQILALALPSAPCLLLKVTMALRLCCQHLTEKNLSTSSFCCDSQSSSICVLRQKLLMTAAAKVCFTQVHISIFRYIGVCVSCVLHLKITHYHTMCICLLLVFVQVKLMTPLAFLSSPLFMSCWTEAQEKKAQVKTELMR